MPSFPLGVSVRPSGVIRATFELEPANQAAALARQLTTAMAGGPAWAEGRVVACVGSRVEIEVPASLVGGNAAALMAGVVAGEAMEVGTLRRCRLVDLILPPGLLPGPAIGASDQAEVGVIIKPSLGLNPSEVADVAAAAVAGGARWIKDDEVLADPSWCRLRERVQMVGSRLPPGVIYFANITGPSTTLVDRARMVVDLGATGVMVAAIPQGLGGVTELRMAGLGVPVLAHRAGSGPWCRNERFGLTGAVLIRLLRCAGADAVVVGAFGGKLFETDAQVTDNLNAARDDSDSLLPVTALLGGGLGPDHVAEQVRRAGGRGVVVLLGSAAYQQPLGLEHAVAVAVAALP